MKKILVEILKLDESQTGRKCSKCGQPATHQTITSVDNIKDDKYSFYLCEFHTDELRERLREKTNY